jgi:serine/threonine-protein kinase HipA
VFWFLATTDGHAKNFSLFLQRRSFELTPCYDVLSAWPVIGKKARQLQARNDTAKSVPTAIATVEKLLQSDLKQSVWTSISEGIAKKAEQFLAAPKVSAIERRLASRIHFHRA